MMISPNTRLTPTAPSDPAYCAFATIAPQPANTSAKAASASDAARRTRAGRAGSSWPFDCAAGRSVAVVVVIGALWQREGLVRLRAGDQALRRRPYRGRHVYPALLRKMSPTASRSSFRSTTSARRGVTTWLGVNERLASVGCQARTRASMRECHQERAHRHLVVLAQDRVRARPDLIVRARAAELLDEVRQEALEPHLMSGSVRADGIEAGIDELLDARLELVANEPDLLEWLPGRVRDVPVFDGGGDIRTLSAAGERDRPVGVQLHLQGQLLWTTAGDVYPDLAHRLDHGGPNLISRLLTSRLGANVGRSMTLEQRLRHLRAPRVVSADKEDVLHLGTP